MITVSRVILVCALVGTGCGRATELPTTSASPKAEGDWEELARVPELGDAPATQILPPSLIEREHAYANHAFPADWLAEARALRSVYPSGKLENESESWFKGDSGWSHAYGSDHWIGDIDAAFFQAFEGRAVQQGFRRAGVDRFGQRLTLTYSNGEIGILLVRDAVHEVHVEVKVPVPSALPANSSLTRALASRPQVLEATRELGAKLESAHLEFGRWHFVFESADPRAALERRGFVTAECNGGVQKWDRARPNCWRSGDVFSGFKHGRLIMADTDSAYEALQKL